MVSGTNSSRVNKKKRNYKSKIDYAGYLFKKTPGILWIGSSKEEEDKKAKEMDNVIGKYYRGEYAEAYSVFEKNDLKRFTIAMIEKVQRYDSIIANSLIEMGKEPKEKIEELSTMELIEITKEIWRHNEYKIENLMERIKGGYEEYCTYYEEYCTYWE